MLNRATVLQMVTLLYFLPTMLCTVVFCLLFTCLNGICLRNLQQDCTLALQLLHNPLTLYEPVNTHGNCHSTEFTAVQKHV